MEATIIKGNRNFRLCRSQIITALDAAYTNDVATQGILVGAHSTKAISLFMQDRIIFKVIIQLFIRYFLKNLAKNL